MSLAYPFLWARHCFENFSKLYIANYNLLNIDRVISQVEVREGREAGTIHRWFTGALLLG